MGGKRVGAGIFLILFALAGLVVPSGARAQEQEEEITEYSELHLKEEVTPQPDGSLTSTGMTGQIRTYNRAGEMTDSVEIQSNHLGASGPDDFQCVNNRNRPRLVISPPAKRTYNDGDLIYGFVWHFYRYNRARQVSYPSGVKSTKQILICSVGGMDGQNGYRILISGPGQTLLARRSYRIGKRWKVAETPENYKLNLGFSVGKGPASVSGGIEQTPTDALRGSYAGPYESDFNDHAHNAVAAWWDANCVGWCKRFSGSPDFQGAVAEVLYEFKQKAPDRTYWIAPFGRYYCSNPFGCG